MLKKRIPTAGRTTAAANVKPQPPTEDDDEPLPPEEEEEDEIKPKSKVAAGRGPDVSAGKKKSLAQAFDEVPASNNADNTPPGKYEAILKDVVMQAKDAKGQSVRMHFELCGDGFQDRNSVTTWFKVFDPEENTVQGGIRALKQTLAKLGYEPTFDELDECFEQITQEKPGVLLKISYSKDAQGNEWQRAVVEDLCDNEIIAAYKDNVPY
jgi:hypothetical protein